MGNFIFFSFPLHLLHGDTGHLDNVSMSPYGCHHHSCGSHRGSWCWCLPPHDGDTGQCSHVHPLAAIIRAVLGAHLGATLHQASAEPLLMITGSMVQLGPAVLFFDWLCWTEVSGGCKQMFCESQKLGTEVVIVKCIYVGRRLSVLNLG